jgi:hypothetical protein
VRSGSKRTPSDRTGFGPDSSSDFQFEGGIKWLNPNPPQTNTKFLATVSPGC